MKEHTTETTDQESTEHRHHGSCGPWGDMQRKMWMYGRMMSGKGSRGSFGGRGRGNRAQRWMYENPTDEQIVEFLEE